MEVMYLTQDRQIVQQMFKRRRGEKNNPVRLEIDLLRVSGQSSLDSKCQ